MNYYSERPFPLFSLVPCGLASEFSVDEPPLGVEVPELEAVG